jgi:hypothetical protein
VNNAVRLRVVFNALAAKAHEAGLGASVLADLHAEPTHGDVVQAVMLLGEEQPTLLGIFASRFFEGANSSHIVSLGEERARWQNFVEGERIVFHRLAAIECFKVCIKALVGGSAGPPIEMPSETVFQSWVAFVMFW